MTPNIRLRWPRLLPLWVWFATATLVLLTTLTYDGHSRIAAIASAHWDNQKTVVDHFAKHGAHFGVKTAADNTKAAVVLLTQSGAGQRAERRDLPGILGSKRCLWAVQGTSNTVFLLGSLFLATNEAPRFDSVVEDAYQHSSAVVFKLAPPDLNSLWLVEQFAGRAKYPPGDSLRGHLTRETHTRLAKLYRRSSKEKFDFEKYRPWKLGLDQVEAELEIQGFRGTNSFENYLFSRAYADKKQVVSLETPKSLLWLWTGMSEIDEEFALLQALDEADCYATQIQEIVAAWKTGDVKKLDEINRKEMDHYPSVKRRFLIDRNREWMPKIEELIRSNKDALVILATQHMVGRNSLVELLEEKGYKVEQR